MRSREIYVNAFGCEYAPVHNPRMDSDFKKIVEGVLVALPGRDKQTELARRIGVKQPTVSRWLNGAVPEGPNFQRVHELARSLGVIGDIRSEDVSAALDAPPARMVKVVGYVGAGAETHYYAVSQGDLDEIPAPDNATDRTVAAEIKGSSLGKLMNGWYVFYDDIRRPVTPDLIGELCIVGLSDGRILVKGITKNHKPGHFDLISNAENEPPIEGVKIDWAAKIEGMRRK